MNALGNFVLVCLNVGEGLFLALNGVNVQTSGGNREESPLYQVIIDKISA